MKSKSLMVLVLALFTATAFGGGKKGSCYSKAISLKSSQSATLVPEYDPEEKEEYDNGVAYYSVTLSRGQAYTIWITGGNASSIELDAFTNDEYYEDREDEPSAGFDVGEVDGGTTKFAYLYADDWDLEEDPKSGKYIVELDGDIGAGTQLYFQKGIKTFKTVGTEDSPKVLSFSTGWKTYSSKMVDGEFFITASLKANRKYRVYLRNGKSGTPLEMSVDGFSESTEAPQLVEDTQYGTAYNDAYVVMPTMSAKYQFVLDGTTSQAFKFYYKMLPTRAIASHVSIPLLPENNYTAQFVPGRVADNLNYYDEIIDEHLCRIYLNKGERWVFETVGADKTIEMRAYDSAGKMLGTNESVDGVDQDTRLVITAAAAGVYYVGVCNPTLDVGDQPTGSAVTLTARNTADMPPADAFDPLDDAYAGATKLTVAPFGTNQVVEAEAFLNGPHRFAANDLYDCYSMACRKGLTYRLQARFEDIGDVSNRFTLASKVFYISGGKEKTVTATGSVSPIEVSRDGALTFKAPISGTVYVRVWVEDGKGLDYPEHYMLATVENGDKQMGLVEFEALGAAGTFSLNAETATYPSGSALTLAENADLKVVFNNPTGFTAKPASTNIVVPAYADGDLPVKVTAKYFDNYDAKYVMSTKTTTDKKTGKKTTTKIYSPVTGDDTAAGAFAITPAATAATLKRTLWAEDPADHFVFTAATNVYYNFKLTDQTGSVPEAAKIVISNATDGVVMEGSEIERALLPAVKTYVIVTHAAEADDGLAYSLTYSRAAGGIVKFTASSFSAKEGSEYATLTVARTGTEGITRVQYYTEAGTAQPGTNYVPVVRGEGMVKWANGDKANKSIKVKLIPDLNAHWAASNLYFRVYLEPVDEYALATGEYLARMGLDSAKVTITEASAKTSGTISLSRFKSGDGAESAVSNVKKPAVPVTAIYDKASGGTTNTLVFARTGGTSGKVSIVVKSAPLKADTAKAGTDFATFSETLTWEDGDAEPKELQFVTYSRGERDTVISRKFNVSMAVVKTGFTPTLSAKAATVTVLNGTFTQTGAAYAKTIPAASGVKLTTTASWVIGDGLLGTLANGSATFTLTGPGLFTCNPRLDVPEGSAGNLTCKFNKETAVSIAAGEDAAVTRLIGTGTTTVVFTLTGSTGNTKAYFYPQADGAPYLFVPFKNAAPDWPMNKAVVTTNLSELAWTLPKDLDEIEGVYTRVRFGTSAKPTQVIGSFPSSTQSLSLTNELAAGKAYYWAVDYAYTNAAELAEEEIAALKWTAGPATWTFTTLTAGAPVTAAVGQDAAGNDIAELLAAGQPVELIQCLKPDLTLSGVGEGEGGKVANKYRLLGGSLPKGVTIDAQGKLVGCPSVVGESRALLQSYNQTSKTETKKVNGKNKKVTTTTYSYGTAIPVKFNVIAAGTALGSWRGPVAVTGMEFPADSRRTGTMTLSVTSAGKLTAKAVVAGVTYTFTGTGGYDELVSRTEDSLAGDFRRFRKENLKCTMTIAKKKYTSYLSLEVDDGAVTNSVALAKASAKAELTMRVANGAKTYVSSDNVGYEGDLVRSNGGTEIGKATLGAFAGYYTMGLAPMNISAADGLPLGSGYLTLTVAADGTVKASGVLADGAAVSFSSVAVPVGDDIADPRACAVVVPVLVSKSAYSLTGFVKIAYEEGGELPVVLSAERILWVRNASTAVTRDGKGFALELAPTGGWYNKTENMQAHYLDSAFAIQGAAAEDLPVEALASGYSFAADASVLDYLATPENLELGFAGNTAKVAARKLVKNKTTGLYDFGTSVNPWNATFKFTRATGIISGTFSAWEWAFKSDEVQDFATKQKEIKKLTHKGVWLWSRDSSADSSLDDHAVSAGYFQLPTSGKWKASLPFSVLATPDEHDWLEQKDLEEEGNL